MRLNRFIGSFDIDKTTLTVVDTKLLHQLRDVLRMKPGQAVVLCDGKGREAVFNIITWDGQSVKFELAGQVVTIPKPVRRAVLYCAVLKKENFEVVAQKATEVGVAKIVPVLTRRTVKSNLSMDRLGRVTHEAAEQCGRASVPTVCEPLLLSEAFKDATGNELNLFFDVSGMTRDIEPLPEPGRVGIFIGPEGGWEEAEITLAKEGGCRIVGLGEFTLRAETAAIIASYLVVHGGK